MILVKSMWSAGIDESLSTRSTRGHPVLHPLRRIVLLLTLIAIGHAPSPGWAGSLLQNGGFDTPTPGLSPPNYPTSISGSGPTSAGPSSAEFWTLYNNFDATTSTELLPSTDPTGSGLMIHLTSTPTSGSFSFFNGLQQAFPTQPGGTASIDVNVLSGIVFLALYADNGATLIDQSFSTVNNQWQRLTVTAAPGTNPNLIVLYTDNATPNTVGEFYADGAGVTAIPEPSSGLLALIGMSGVALWVRRTRMRPGRRPGGPSI
jgi:hypothetical protein